MSSSSTTSATVDPDEVAYFERLADRWWDAAGPFWPLHRLNEFRVAFLRDRIACVLGREPSMSPPLSGLRVLDIGCGGGILSEAMARLGADVVGADIVDKNLRVARLHASESGLKIDYRLASAESLAADGESFDAVLNMEVVEHVDRCPEFLHSCGRLVRPGGLMSVATINRTWAAALIALFGAEYVLRWLPRGTHRYRKLVRPEEVLAGLGSGFELMEETGVRVNPLTREFSYTRWMGVNYMMLLRRRGDRSEPSGSGF
jgi:2-polyprenyl-6-hydroxyphenyl methylase / 3-demethylubiquinone-9 3-methyltransferase